MREHLYHCRTVADQLSVCFTFDLQKTLVCPVILTGVAYHKRQLATYHNLGINNLAVNSATMYKWHEGLASCGTNDTGSCVIKYAESVVRNGAKSLTAFCHRNFTAALVVSFAVSNYQLVSHAVGSLFSAKRCWLRGHFEKYKKMRGDVCIPQHWIDVVKCARNRRPLAVVEMTNDDSADVISMSRQRMNRKHAGDGSQEVKWLDIQRIKFCGEDLNTMQVQYVDCNGSRLTSAVGHCIFA